MLRMGKKANILYVEDDTTLSYVTKDNLEMKGYSIDACEEGSVALEWINTRRYDLCILDVMLPKMDGFTLAGKIREKNSDIPILFLTARSTMEDRIYGLQLGADDYITKPFSIEELILKIEVFLKRSKIISPEERQPSIFKVGQLTFDAANQELIDGKKRQQLTYRESELLKYLCFHAGQIVKREEILMKVWENDEYYSSRSLDVFISRLRKLLKSDPSVRIDNIHNVGYRLTIAGT
jgi:two-component system, OmpR family, response regulator VicR